MRYKIAVIGAGCTGRGFAARFFSGEDTIVFIDKNETLADNLNQAGSYHIQFADREDMIISNFRAYTPGPEGMADAADADYFFTAVSARCLDEAAAFLQKIALLRAERGLGPMDVVLCENGLNLAERVREAMSQGTCPRDSEPVPVTLRVSEAAVFCTTVRKPGSDLDILSESYYSLPYESKNSGITIDVPGLVPEADMAGLMRRKIFTYNLLSACIAYQGYEKGYTDYAEAANDPEISGFCDRVSELIAPAYVKEFGISEDEQRRFSGQALSKFRNRLITDTIEKNARDAARKLQPSERIIGPMLLLKKYGTDTGLLAHVAALALDYGEREERLLRESVPFPQECAEEIKEACDDFRQRGGLSHE